LPSLGDAKGAPATTGVDPRRPPRHGLQWERPLSSLPLHRLDRDHIERPPGSLSNPTNPLWGFPFLCAPLQGGKGRGGGKEGAVRPPLPARRCWRPTAARRCRTRRHVGRERPHQDEKAGPGTVRGAGRRREQLHNAASFVKPATTTPSPRRENLGFPPSLAALEPLTP
jgi:hypothetical protein